MWLNFCCFCASHFQAGGGAPYAYDGAGGMALSTAWFITEPESEMMASWGVSVMTQELYGFVWKCWVNIPNYSHLIGIMIINHWV